MAEQLTAPASEEEAAERAGTIRVVLLDLAVAGMVAPLIWWAAAFERPVSIPIAIAVVVLFLVAEWFPIDVEIGDQSHAFSFTAVPLVVGLCLLPPELVIVLRALSSGFVLLVIHRQGAIKLATNLLSHVLQACAAALVILPFVDGTPDRPIEWLAVSAAVIAAELVGTGLVTVAISLFEGGFDRELLEGAVTGWLAVVPDVSISLVAVIVLDVNPSAVWLVGGIGVLFAVVTRLYSQVTARYRVLEVLDGFTSRLGEAVADGTMREVLLEQLAELLHAESAWIEQPGLEVPSRLVNRTGASLTEPLLDRAGFRRRVGAGAGTDDIVGLVHVDADALLVGVERRRGEIRTFDGEDVRLFNLLIGHAGIGLQNVGLVEQLQGEVHANELLATRDQLTGLPNRTLFHRWVLDTLALGAGAAVMVLGIDRFKEVNDTLGHAAGDALLQQIGERVANQGFVARLGGDEFGILWAGADRDAVTEIAQAVVDAIGGLYRIDGIDLDLDVSASAGLTFGAPGTTAEDAITLLRQADVAMYLAKEGRTSLGIYRADLDTFSSAQLALVGALRAAIDAEQLELHYQPQVDLRTEAVVGAEALLRWTPAGRAPIPTPQFIEIAERTGLIKPLTRLVLRDAVRQARRWLDAGHRWRVSANLSSRNIGEPDLVAFVAGLLADHELPPELLEIELTETSVMDDPALAASVMGELRALGVSIAVDDFGTGHSSLAQLTRLPVDQLKIDRSFVLDMETDAAGLAVVQTIVDLGQRLGLGIVAEGVETAANVQALRSMGCATAQGYYYARPMAPAAFEAWIASRTSDPRDATPAVRPTSATR
ncbi:MAG: putative Diguanylate cyclase/phosphodiesterase [Acidimicrobiales bacterium]|nr:putative Diguanylate cyclase/phosphodiesterase [Acidimicrobiales bacterium]